MLNAEAARTRCRKVADQRRPSLPKLAGFIDEAETDVLAYMTFPQQQAKLHSTNPIEGLNGGIERRTEVVGFPGYRKLTSPALAGEPPPATPLPRTRSPEVGQFDDIPIRSRIGYGAAMWFEKGGSNSRLLSAEGAEVTDKHAKQSHEEESEEEKEMRPIYSSAKSARLGASKWLRRDRFRT